MVGHAARFCHGGKVYFFEEDEYKMRIVSLDNHTPLLSDCPDWYRNSASEVEELEEIYHPCDLNAFQLSGFLVLIGSGCFTSGHRTFVFDTDNESSGWVGLRGETPALTVDEHCVAVVNETAYCFSVNGLFRFSLREGWSEVESVPAFCRNVSGMCPVGSLIVGHTYSRTAWALPRWEVVAYDTISGEWQQWGDLHGYRVDCHMDPSHTLVLSRPDETDDYFNSLMLAELDPALLYPHCGMRWARVAPDMVLDTTSEDDEVQ
ncbi:hypothetical protein KIPB_002102 [Kipferlia bialata]|uniref:Uncharacterized protein n=1 Tax=Kipferlia bialata TaxID=797122 RepID=A0A391NUR6_9EUKA|nr:hypothetical protein KIPB_002102 [Kipferlia bialata]|eukprot:g2102.t1